MKVLHVISNISKGNGIMSVLMNYYKNIDRTKIQFGFLFYEDRKITYEKEIISLGGKIHKVESISNLIKFNQDIKKLTINYYKEYDILHIHDFFMTTFLLGIKSRFGIKKIIIHSHNTKFSDHKIREIRNRILSIPNSFVPDYYFACSEEAGKSAFGKKFEKKGIIVNNAIDLKVFHFDEMIKKNIRKELNVESKFVIGHVGGFVNQKNHKFIIEVFKKILERRPDSVLILVSEGPLKNKIQDLCIKDKINDKVLFLGTRDDVYRIMQSFDRFIFPSIFEGFGIVLIEAQAIGVPCVFSDVVPKVVNIISEQNTVLNLRESYDIWADAIINERKANEDVSKKIRNSGFDIVFEAKKIQKLYLEMV